ncbi:MAG: CCA tRNA nucleotidyltransferase, partial [Chloroflexi bacterium]|nr:CCA tRNA nucleotidyltransferase [Chloroflexota bacterium]
VVDICGGLADLQARLVRALHERSFQDDATRVLRAARYAARLGFRLEAETERWLRRDAHYLDTISGDRLLHELDRLWQEPVPEDALSLLQALGALSATHPALRWDAALARAFSQGRGRRPPDIPLASLYNALLGSRMGPAEAQGFVARLKLPPQRARAVREAAALGATRHSWEEVGAQHAAPLLPSRVVARLEGHDPAALLTWALAGPEPQATLLRRYLEEWRHARPALTGDALLALGVPPGPDVGEYLTRLRNARLDGLATTEAEERALVARWLGLPERPA